MSEETSPRLGGKGGDSDEQGGEEEDRKPAATNPPSATKRAASERQSSGNSSGEEEHASGRKRRRRASGTDSTTEPPASPPAKAKAPSSSSNAISLQEKWDEMYNRLARFKEKNGHCLVPNRYKEDPSLGSWVATQRRTYKIMNSGGGATSGMNAERAQRLQDLGFEWSTTDPRHVPWEERYEELKVFVEANGHAEVPMRWEENVQLSNWVSKQRQDYKLLKLGKTSRLTERRRKLLNEIGFVWEIARKGRRLRVAKAAPRGSPAGSSDESSASDQADPSEEQNSPSASAPKAAAATRNRRDDGVAIISRRSQESHSLNTATPPSVPGLQNLLRATASAPTEGAGSLFRQGASLANTAAASHLYQNMNTQQQLHVPSSFRARSLLGQIPARMNDFLDQQRHPFGLSQLSGSNNTGMASLAASLAASFTGAQGHPSSLMGSASHLGSVGTDMSSNLLAAQIRSQNLLSGSHIHAQTLQRLQQLSGYPPSLQSSTLSLQSQYGMGNNSLPGQVQQQSNLRYSMLGPSSQEAHQLRSLLGATLPSRSGRHDPPSFHSVPGLRSALLQQQGLALPPPQAEQQGRTVALPANNQRPPLEQQQDHRQGESKSETSTRPSLRDPDGRTAE